MANHIDESQHLSSYEEEDLNKMDNSKPKISKTIRRSENVGEESPMILSPMLNDESQSVHIARSYSFDGLKKDIKNQKRFRIRGPSSESSDDNLAKWRKVDKMLQKFDNDKRRREDKFIDFVQTEGKNFLLSINELVKANIPKIEAEIKQSESSDHSEQPQEKWIVDRKQAVTSVKDWQESMTKIDIHSASRVYLTVSESL